ncbi:MAG: M14 family zinc carboxypeptidase, partial [Acidobacteriota bacterium]
HTAAGRSPIVTSPDNHRNLAAIQQRHQTLSDPTVEAPNTTDMPVVVQLGYGVHGNEASATNSAVLVAYHLAAARDIEPMLERMVILLQPALNPDGLDRFAHWVNSHRGAVTIADPMHREHREPWPSGRTNHYWYDLNRDWLLLQHPESRGRVEAFQTWRPNLLTDVHEMGTNSTYFFQPGVPSRTNPLTPEDNVTLTQDIAQYHARALDQAGRLYYTEQSFDDFYYGKGSTYPDVQGSVGILFEQASPRGHEQMGVYGRVTFPRAIHSQFLTSLSSLQAADDLRQRLLDHMANFYRDAWREAGDGGWVFSEPTDPWREARMLQVLRLHDIEVRRAQSTIEVDGTRYEGGRAWVVPERQRQSKLARALFETRTRFNDNTFYDVSAWTLPLSFGIPYAEVSGAQLSELDAPLGAPPSPSMVFSPSPTAVAYAFSWNGYYAPRAVQSLLEADIMPLVATEPFGDESTDYGRGTIIVPVGGQAIGRAEIERRLTRVAQRDGLEIRALETGLTASGIDLGSPSSRPLHAIRPALVVGRGVGAYEAGEVWHYVDHRLRVPVTLVEQSWLDTLDLDEYTHLILVQGRWRLDDQTVEKIARFVREGGVVVAMQGAAQWADEHLLGAAADTKAQDTTTETGRQAPEVPRPYAAYRADRAVDFIGGAIFEVELDLTHPLAYGVPRARLPVFRDTTIVLRAETNPYTAAAWYTDAPKLAGYASDANVERITGTPAVVGTKMGRGLVVRMADNPSFRGVWHGTQKLLANALFFGQIVDNTFVPDRYEE